MKDDKIYVMLLLRGFRLQEGQALGHGSVEEYCTGVIAQSTTCSELCV